MNNRQPFLFESSGPMTDWSARAQAVEGLNDLSMPIGAFDAAPMPEIRPQSQGGVNVSERAVMLSVEFRSLGVKRSLSVGKGVSVEGTDPRMLRASKILLESKAFDALKKADGKMRAWIDERSLPSMFRSGVYLIPVPLVAEVYEKLESFTGERRYLVGEFEREYSQVVSDARGRLGTLFAEKDYPQGAALVALFSVVYQFIEIGAPGSLASISAALFEQERDKASKLWTSAAAEAVAVLRKEMSDLVSHLVERLTPGPDGKRKEFKGTTVENLRDWLSLVEARNITGDAELGELARKARALLSGRSPETLRKDLLSRERVRDGMGQIKAKLDTLLSDAPGRRVVVSDESEVEL